MTGATGASVAIGYLVGLTFLVMPPRWRAPHDLPLVLMGILGVAGTLSLVFILLGWLSFEIGFVTGNILITIESTGLHILKSDILILGFFCLSLFDRNNS